MKIIVNAHKCVIDKTPVNEQEINITKCEFEFADEITDDFVKEAYFTLNGATYKQIIVDNECDIPSEVLEKKGDVEIGVVAFLVENDETFKRYNPSPAYFPTWQGSLKDAENSEPITPTDKEQIEQILNDVVAQVDNLDVDAEKEEHTTTITITKKDGTQKNVQVLDGEKGDKGDKGDAGSIKFIIVQVLPTENIEEDAMYLVPLENPESQENRFAEYIYVNGVWELLGKVSIQIDLSNYYTKQEVNALIPNELSDLQDDSTHRLVTDIEKNTWNGKANVSDIPTKTSDLTNDSDYTTKTYVDGLVGDINTALDAINGEVV